MDAISDFAVHAPVPDATRAAYRDRVPGDLLEVWDTYGLGTFGCGFLRVVDPMRYQAEIGHCIGKTQGDGVAVPILATGLGDLIAWEPSVGVVGILYREGRTVGINTTIDNFLFMVDLDGPEELSGTLHWDVFPEAVASHGPLPYDRSYVTVPPGRSRQSPTVAQLQQQDTVTAIRAAVDAHGVIGH